VFANFRSFWEQAWNLFGRTVCKVLRKCKTTKISGKVRTQDFYVETPLAQLRWKNHDLPRVGFNHFTKRAKHVTKVTHIVTIATHVTVSPILVTHNVHIWTAHVIVSLDRLHTYKASLGLDTLNSHFNERRGKNTPHFCASN